MDVLVMQAYQILEDERCQLCGSPRYLCQNSDPKLQVRVKTYHCYAKQELEEHEEKEKSDRKGTTLYPEWYDLDDRPLESFRDLYYQQMARDAADDADEDGQD